MRPVVSWATPAAGLTGDVDFIQLVLHNDDTDLQVGNFVTRPAIARSFQFLNRLTPNYILVIDVRLLDLFDDTRR